MMENQEKEEQKEETKTEEDDIHTDPAEMQMDESYQFDSFFEMAVLSRILRDYDFYEENKKWIKSEYFGAKVLQLICKIGLVHITKYEECPSYAILRNELINEYHKTRKHKDEDDEDIKTNLGIFMQALNDVLKIDIDYDFERKYTSDCIRNFGMRMELRKKLISSLDKVKSNRGWQDIPADIQTVLDTPETEVEGDFTGSIFSCEDILAMENTQLKWIWDTYIPANSVMMIFGWGGTMKSYLMYYLASQISRGLPVAGYDTTKTPVIIIDKQNPDYRIAIDINKFNLSHSGVDVWASSLKPKITPPNLDEDDWKKYLTLPKGSFLIFDTMSSFLAKANINDNKEMNPVMQRLKEIRNAGYSVLFLHNSNKGARNVFTGASVLHAESDLQLCTLRVNDIDEDEQGHGIDKPIDDITKPIKLFVDPSLKFRAGKGADPVYYKMSESGLLFSHGRIGEFIIKARNHINNTIPNSGNTINKGAFETWMKSRGMTITRARTIIDKYNGIHWIVGEGENNSKLILPISCNHTEEEIS